MTSILWSTLRYGISPMPSNTRAQKAMISLIPKPTPAEFVELGSGWGQFANQLASLYPNTKVIGYERSVLPFLVSKLLYRRNNLDFHFVDFWQCTYPQGSVLFSYLYPEGMKKLSANTQSHQGWLISNTFSLPDHTPMKKLQLKDRFRSNVYLYKLPVEEGV